MKWYSVYIRASRTRVLYVGVTGNLARRVWQHQHDICPDSFTSRYAVHKLVYTEEYTVIEQAIEREKQLKSWRRQKKVALIERRNPGWRDLSLPL